MNTSLFNIMSKVVEYANMNANCAHRAANHEDTKELINEKAAKFAEIETLIRVYAKDTEIEAIKSAIGTVEK